MKNKMSIRSRISLIWFFIEVLFTKGMLVFGIEKNYKHIPRGLYCYERDEERNKKEPLKTGYWIKTCKYHRSTAETRGIACTYIGYYGFDACLYDECKVCGVNEDIDF